MARIGQFIVQISHHPFYISVEKKGRTIFFTQSIEEARDMFGNNYEDEKHILNTLYGAGVVVREHHAKTGMHKTLDGSTSNHHPNNMFRIPEWKF